MPSQLLATTAFTKFRAAASGVEPPPAVLLSLLNTTRTSSRTTPTATMPPTMRAGTSGERRPGAPGGG